MAKNLPEMQEVHVQSLVREGPLEKEMATYPSILPGESYGQGAWRATVQRVTKSQTQVKQLSTHVHLSVLLMG